MQCALPFRENFRPDEISLFRWLTVNFPDRLPNEGMRIDFTAADYETVKAVLERQIPRQRTAIASEQRRALAAAAEQLDTTKLWMTRIVCELSKRYGYRAASRTACFFASHCLLDTLRYMSRYQIADGTEAVLPYDDHFRNDDWAPMRALLIHDATELLEVVIRDPNASAYSRVLVPPEEMENSGINVLYAEVEDEVINIPLDIWLDFVVPQCAFERAQETPGFFHWDPVSGTYLTSGTIWSAQGSAVASRVRRDDPPFIVYETDGRRSGRDAQIYLNCMNDPPVQMTGPLAFFPAGMHLAASEAQTTKLRELVEPIDRRNWRAPTVWHAAAWLSDLVGWERKGRPSQAFSEDCDLASMAPGALLFRGQADGAWDIVPKLLRPEHDNVKSRHAIVKFSLAVSHLQYQADQTTQPAEAAIGAGQHYGLATNLVDFTLDPLIASFFACDSERPELGPEGAVYWLPLYRAYELGAKVVIPPYWVERLYRQRGCFIDSFRLLSGAQLKNECFSIRFPRDRSYCSSDFGNVNNQLYPESQWLQKAIHWAQDSAERFGLPALSYEHAKSFADDLVSFAGEPEFINGSLNFRNADKQLSLLVDLIEWLSLTLDLNGKQPKLEMDCQVVNALAQQNPGIFVAVRALGIYLPEIANRNEDKFLKYFTAMVQCLRHADDANDGNRDVKTGA